MVYVARELRKRQILPVNQNFSTVYFSLAKFQLVSCNLSCYDLANDLYSKTAKTVISHLRATCVTWPAVQSLLFMFYHIP